MDPITGTEGHGTAALSSYPNLVREMRGRFMSAALQSNPVTGWFISRRKAVQGRSIINEEELIKVLLQFGVQPVVLEELTLSKQLSLFASARLLIGPHGAGMVHALFMQERSGIIELLSTSCPSGTNKFWMDLLNHRHREILSTTPVTQMADPFTVDPDQLAQVIQELL